MTTLMINLQDVRDCEIDLEKVIIYLFCYIFYVRTIYCYNKLIMQVFVHWFIPQPTIQLSTKLLFRMYLVC